jgi:small subunit ribosomal protein S4
MGDPKKKHKRYTTPKRPYDQSNLNEELSLIGSYGLRNKRELWRIRTRVSKLRRMAREALSMDPIERSDKEKQLIRKTHHLGLVSEGARLEDVLSLGVLDFLERRLQTVVYRKGMAKSLFQARQFINHGHVAINGVKIRSPSYVVSGDDESGLEFAASSPLSEKDHSVRQDMMISDMTGG